MRRGKPKKRDDESKKGKLIRKRKALIEKNKNIVDSDEGAVVPPTINSDSKIRVASDCTGLGSEVIALTLAGLHSQVEGKFWSDNDPSKRTLFRIVCSELGHDAGHCDTDISERILLDEILVVPCHHSILGVTCTLLVIHAHHFPVPANAAGNWMSEVWWACTAWNWQPEPNPVAAS